MYLDDYTGKYHAHHRDYSPIHARWLSEDPAGYADGMNLYAAYMGVNGRDPSGLEVVDRKNAILSLLRTAHSNLVGGSITDRMLIGWYEEYRATQFLKRAGRQILVGPAGISLGDSLKRINAGGADIIAYNSATNQLELLDAKFLTSRKNVSAVKTFTMRKRLVNNLNNSLDKVDNITGVSTEKIVALKKELFGMINALNNLGDTPSSKGIAAVLKSSTLVQIKVAGGFSRLNKVAGVTKRISDMGIGFVSRNSLTRRVFSTSAKVINKTAKPLAVLGIIMSVNTVANAQAYAKQMDADLASELAELNALSGESYTLVNPRAYRSQVSGVIAGEAWSEGTLGIIDASFFTSDVNPTYVPTGEVHRLPSIGEMFRNLWSR